MSILQLPLCLLGRHRRSRARARYDGNTFYSVCTGCGRAMSREAEGWRIIPHT
jgi:hypothetical protein